MGTDIRQTLRIPSDGNIGDADLIKDRHVEDLEIAVGVASLEPAGPGYTDLTLLTATQAELGLRFCGQQRTWLDAGQWIAVPTGFVR